MHFSIEERIAELEAGGWKRRHGGPFIETIGPLWVRSESSGWVYGLLGQERHLNPANVVHGGCLQALIDHALSTLAWEAVGRIPCLTVETTSQFLATAKANDFIVARGSEIGRSRSLIFMRGTLEANDRLLMSVQAIFKIAKNSS